MIGALLSSSDPSLPLTSNPRTFGDIKVWAQKPLVPEDSIVPERFYKEMHKQLWMSKNNTPFLMISQDVNNNTTGLYLLKDKDRAILCLNSTNNTGEWHWSSYGIADSLGTPKGNTLIDLDFNGNFDFKIITDNNGNLVSRYIRLEDSWQKIEKCNLEEAIVFTGHNYYKFDPNIGEWRQKG